MMQHKLLAIFSFSLLFCGCLGPKVDTCILDLNVLDRAIDQEVEPISKERVKAMLRESKPLYCVPPDEKKADFYAPLQTGGHYYSSTNWGILMHWIEQHRK